MEDKPLEVLDIEEIELSRIRPEELRPAKVAYKPLGNYKEATRFRSFKTENDEEEPSIKYISMKYCSWCCSTFFMIIFSTIVASRSEEM